MPNIQYLEKNLSAERLAIIDHANDIISEYEAEGYDLTLRQLYYQFVARDLIPNSQKSYKRLGDIISDGRMLGLIDWDSISDRLREVRSFRTYEDPADRIRVAARTFMLNLWEVSEQEYRPEVWVEKDALAEVVERAADKFRTPVMVCRGYMSQSAIWQAGHYRFREQVDQGLTPVVIHLGDHDPSGIDMTRDIQERLSLFAEGEVRVERIALNMDQVRQYNPPPNPAKITDSRAAGYISEHGRQSWELDALEPRVLDDLIVNAIKQFVDMPDWREAVEREEGERQRLHDISDRFDDVIRFLDDDEE